MTRGGGGPRLATLITWPCLWPADQDGPGPPRCSGSDLDRRGIHDLSITVSTDVPNNSEGKTGALRRNVPGYVCNPGSPRERDAVSRRYGERHQRCPALNHMCNQSKLTVRRQVRVTS